MAAPVYILGISAFYHDSAAVLIKDGIILAAAQEERFVRIKHFPGFPKNAIKFCLDQANINLNKLDNIVFYDKPFLKFERLLETYYTYAPKGLISFLSFAPAWMKEKLFIKRAIREGLREVCGVKINKKIKPGFSEHHLSHAASAFYPSPFKKAAIITVDGVGEWSTATIMRGNGNEIESLKELRFPHSYGLLYSAFTYFLGFRVNSGEYKLMGLAPYGNKSKGLVDKYLILIEESLATVYEDGSLFLNMDFFDFATGKKMIKEGKWKKLFGFERRDPESHIEQHHCDVALAAQIFLNKSILKMAMFAKKITGEKNLCLAGGVALNCVTNLELRKKSGFEKIWIQPAAGDAGGALGAALSLYYMKYKERRRVGFKGKDSMCGALLGPEYENTEIKKVLDREGAVYEFIDDFEIITEKTAKYIERGGIVGWFQGRMEWGPRALGNRSILGNPTDPEMQKRLNLKIKFRESFRPFAPAILREDCGLFFKDDFDSPYMLFITHLKQTLRKKALKSEMDPDFGERINSVRSNIPAVTHVDYSARLQTVDRDTNPRFRMLIEKFKSLTGYGVVVNTSFNVRGEPIVCSVKDAFDCFMNTGMDYLVAGNCILKKSDQNSDLKKERRNFIMD